MDDDGQLGLFDRRRSGRQAAHLERVSSRISRLVLAFFSQLEVEGRTDFYGTDLLAFVRRDDLVAPDSPGRTMRDLRSAGRLNYEVLSRKNSLYRRLP